MRILTLTILFFASFYYFWPREEKATAIVLPKIDSIKLKMGAPNRAERILTVGPKKEEAAPVAEASSEAVETERAPAVEVSSTEETEEVEEIEEVAWSESESAWNNELKDILYRLEPQEGENLHKAYIGERESFLSEIDNLMNEKQQKSSPDAVQEIEQMISGLEEKHEAKLKDILGANYEAVREQYDSYMENAPASSEE